jgi:hypothetical protein
MTQLFSDTAFPAADRPFLPGPVPRARPTNPRNPARPPVVLSGARPGGFEVAGHLSGVRDGRSRHQNL